MQTYQKRQQRTDELRAIPLEELARWFGMQRDRYDKCKWRLGGMRISISGETQQFFDHASQQGGGGAIDFVQYVKRFDFSQARGFLDTNVSSAVSDVPFSKKHRTNLERSRKPAKPRLNKQFVPPLADPLKWQVAREYLIGDRYLPEEIVDELYRRGDIYGTGLPAKTLEQQIAKGNRLAYEIVNVVFPMRDPFKREVIKGASLRAARRESKFQGMAEGSSKAESWFYFDWGVGDRVSKVVLVESAIDAMSAAALSQETTHKCIRFLATSGEGAFPGNYLDSCANDGIDIVAAFDNDAVGWKLMQKLGERYEIQVALPPRGKDWNETLRLTAEDRSSS
ncbi:MAG: toprim domain-containing protein [Cyanobacteria bacterium J06642_2]